MVGLHIGMLDALPLGPNSFNVMQCYGKFGIIAGWTSLLNEGLMPPPLGNSRSGTGC